MNHDLTILINTQRRRGLSHSDIAWIQRVASSSEIAGEIVSAIQTYRASEFIKKTPDIDHWQPIDISILMHCLMIFERNSDLKKICKVLLNCGANLNTDVASPFYLAIVFKDVSLVKLFLDNGANINQVLDAGGPALPIGLGERKLTPLAVATINNDPVMVNYLLDRGANASDAPCDGYEYAWVLASDSIKAKCIRLHPAYNKISESLGIYLGQANTKEIRQKILNTLNTLTNTSQ